MAKEYIEREAAIRELLNDAPEQVFYSREDAADCIRYITAIDVAPVRHGRWVYDYKKRKAICYCCGSGYRVAYNYCPNCGAYMMGESNGKCE